MKVIDGGRKDSGKSVSLVEQTVPGLGATEFGGRFGVESQNWLRVVHQFKDALGTLEKTGLRSAPYLMRAGIALDHALSQAAEESLDTSAWYLNDSLRSLFKARGIVAEELKNESPLQSDSAGPTPTMAVSGAIQMLLGAYEDATRFNANGGENYYSRARVGLEDAMLSVVVSVYGPRVVS